MNLKPLNDIVIIRQVDAKGETDGGLYIPDRSKEKPQQGEVVAVGAGRTLSSGKIKPLTVKVGDTIIFGKHKALEVKVGGEEYLFLPEDDVLAIVAEKKK